MIETADRIIDPVKFLEADPALTESISAQGAALVSGTDIDLSVIKLPEDVPSAPHIFPSHMSAMFGNLYMKHLVSSIEINDQLFRLEWYPSPTAVNELSEALGLTPGDNALRFTHSEGAIVPVERYIGHLAQGEYPQSTDPRSQFFGHDRNADHAIGAILLPPTVVKSFVDKATKEHPGSGQLKKDEKSRSVAHTFDFFTYWYNNNVVKMNLAAEGDKDKVRLAINRAVEHAHFHAGDLAKWITDLGSTYNVYDALQSMHDHLDDLRPIIEQLRLTAR